MILILISNIDEIALALTEAAEASIDATDACTWGWSTWGEWHEPNLPKVKEGTKVGTLPEKLKDCQCSLAEVDEVKPLLGPTPWNPPPMRVTRKGTVGKLLPIYLRSRSIAQIMKSRTWPPHQKGGTIQTIRMGPLRTRWSQTPNNWSCKNGKKSGPGGAWNQNHRKRVPPTRDSKGDKRKERSRQMRGVTNQAFRTLSLCERCKSLGSWSHCNWGSLSCGQSKKELVALEKHGRNPGKRMDNCQRVFCSKFLKIPTLVNNYEVTVCWGNSKHRPKVPFGQINSAIVVVAGQLLDIPRKVE